VIRSIVEWGLPLIAGAIGAAATWLAFEFAAKPYLRFRALRATIQAQLLTLETTFLAAQPMHNPSRAAMIELHNAEIERAARALRESGIALAAMADTEWLLNKLLGAMGYDLRTAGTALMGVHILLAKRALVSWNTLLPPLDDRGEEIISIVRQILHLRN
jgi:hypothetical protein